MIYFTDARYFHKDGQHQLLTIISELNISDLGKRNGGENTNLSINALPTYSKLALFLLSSNKHEYLRISLMICIRQKNGLFCSSEK